MNGTGPRFAASELTTPKLSFADAVAVFRDAGVEGIGIAAQKLGADDDLERFQESGLEATICIPSLPDDRERYQGNGIASATFSSVASILPRPDLLPRPEQAAHIERVCDGIRRLASFEPVCVRLDTGVRGDRTPEEAVELVVDGLRTAARAGAEVGVTIGLEPVRASLREEYGWVNTITDGVELLDAVGEPNMGLIFDTWHLWDTEGVLDEIREHATRFVAVHLGDWREPTRSKLDRALPGDGAGDLPATLQALDEGGYQGWYELEIVSDTAFEDSLWNWDPGELLRTGRDKFVQAWEDRRG